MHILYLKLMHSSCLFFGNHYRVSFWNSLLNSVCLRTEALFGRAPFASRSYAELEEKIRSNQPIEVSVEQQNGFLISELLDIEQL